MFHHVYALLFFCCTVLHSVCSSRCANCSFAAVLSRSCGVFVLSVLFCRVCLCTQVCVCLCAWVCVCACELLWVVNNSLEYMNLFRHALKVSLYFLFCSSSFTDCCALFNQVMCMIYWGFPTRMVYLYYISYLRYTILAGNSRYAGWQWCMQHWNWENACFVQLFLVLCITTTYKKNWSHQVSVCVCVCVCVCVREREREREERERERCHRRRVEEGCSPFQHPSSVYGRNTRSWVFCFLRKTLNTFLTFTLSCTTCSCTHALVYVRVFITYLRWFKWSNRTHLNKAF